MLTARLMLERLDKEGNTLEKREQLSRSFLLNLMELLYIRQAQASRDVRDIANNLRSLSYNLETNQNLGVASPAGEAGAGLESIHGDRCLEGQDIGIQVGRGTTSPTPTDYKMEDRIGHGRTGILGSPASFTNPSFETGDLTGWASASSGAFTVDVSNTAWGLKDGTYLCRFHDTATASAGDYAEISQSIDLTNVSYIRFQLGATGYGTLAMRIFIDGYPIYYKQGMSEDWPDQLVDVSEYTGTHTVKFRTVVVSGTMYSQSMYLDKIETLKQDQQIEYGGCELVNINFSDPNGEFTIRRYFTNNSGASITINEVGIQAKGEAADVWAFLIARDVVSPGVEVADTEILRVTYVPQITV